MMNSVSLIALASFLAPSNAITLYLAGDSTMAADGNGDGTVGWGTPIATYFPGLTVVNDAIAGRSARSFTREDRFEAIYDVVESGDYVIIEFGHNDGGTPCISTDDGRSDCAVGADGYASTCISDYDDETELVLTYEAYYVNAANLLKSKGANVILSSPTVDNPWETGTFVYTPSRFVQYAEDAATASGSVFVNHELYVADLWYNEGAAVTDADFPIDHTHTSAAGAAIVARAFIYALEVTSSTLNDYIV